MRQCGERSHPARATSTTAPSRQRPSRPFLRRRTATASSGQRDHGEDRRARARRAAMATVDRERLRALDARGPGRARRSARASARRRRWASSSVTWMRRQGRSGRPCVRCSASSRSTVSRTRASSFSASITSRDVAGLLRHELEEARLLRARVVQSRGEIGALLGDVVDLLGLGRDVADRGERLPDRGRLVAGHAEIHRRVRVVAAVDVRARDVAAGALDLRADLGRRVVDVGDADARVDGDDERAVARGTGNGERTRGGGGGRCRRGRSGRGRSLGARAARDREEDEENEGETARKAWVHALCVTGAGAI